ncbi:MAG TPA: hypothetical protein VFP05_06000 [Thermomicrobiales bacterium]|jgi:hypothetical protein|nr:hypothetical protein [Thermomicrobiales bacterium]
MVGGIGRGTLRAAGQPGLDALLEEWARGVRSQFGDVVQYIGRVHGDPTQIVVIVLFPDEETYQRFGQERPDRWAQDVLQHLEDGMQWEEIDVNQV